MVCHHPARFGDHRHCWSGDMNLLVSTVILRQMWDIRGCICPLTPAINIFSKAHDMSCHTRLEQQLKEQFLRKLFSVSNE